MLFNARITPLTMPLKKPEMLSVMPLMKVFSRPNTSLALALIVSQFLYSNTPMAIRAPMAITTRPMGLVTKAITAPKAVDNPVATAITTL